MTDSKSITRGDSYDWNERYLFRIECVTPTLTPYDLAGCTVRTTFKPAPTDPADDPTDTDAPIKHEIMIDVSGGVTSSTGLRLESTALAGVLIEDLTKAESIGLPLGVPLGSDVQITNAVGKDITVIMIGTLTTIDGYTNRTTP